MTAPDVVVAGGGVIGLSIAWQSAARGLSVLVADPHPGRGASWAAAGMLAPVTEVHYGEERLLQLNLARALSTMDRGVERRVGSGLRLRANGNPRRGARRGR
jgi:glycine oxidase